MATGRVTVAPGQTVASSWGNTVFDQSVMCFASSAQRDAQYPPGSRHPGAVTYQEDTKQLTLWDGTQWRTVPAGTVWGFARRATEQSVPSDGWVQVLLDTSEGTSGLFVGNGFTLPVAGVYAASWQVAVNLTGTAPGSVNIVSALYKNGTEFNRGSQYTSSSQPALQSFSSNGERVFLGAANDVLTLWAYISVPGTTKALDATATQLQLHYRPA